MKRYVDDEDMIVYFEGDWPSVMAIPHIMKSYPNHKAMVLSHENFKTRYGKGKPI